MIKRMCRGCLIVLAFVFVLSPVSQAQQTYAQQAILADDAAFQDRVQIAVVQAAVATANEAVTTPNHDARVVLARTVLLEPDSWKIRFTLAVVADVTITTAATDATIATRVAAVWNALAGIG